MPHHDIYEIHTLVKKVLFSALELEPHRAMRVLDMQPLEHLSRLCIREVELAEYASIATILKGFVD
jgi:hypothetical protein